MDPPRLALRDALRPLADDVDVAADGPVRRGKGRAGLVEDGVLRADDHVRLGELAELLQLLRRPRGLRRATSTQDVHIRDAGPGEGVEDMLRHVGVIELGHGLAEDPGHVDRHVAHPHHDGRGARRDQPLEQVPVGVRMPAVPGDEVGGGDAAVEVLPLDPQSPVAGCPVGEDDGVIDGVEIGHRQVLPDRHIAQEAHAGLVEGLVEGVPHRPDAQVIGRDAVAHQPEGHREAVDDVDLGRHVLLADERVRRVDARGPRSDDSDPQGSGHGYSSGSPSNDLANLNPGAGSVGSKCTGVRPTTSAPRRLTGWSSMKTVPSAGTPMRSRMIR